MRRLCAEQSPEQRVSYTPCVASAAGEWPVQRRGRRDRREGFYALRAVCGWGEAQLVSEDLVVRMAGLVKLGNGTAIIHSEVVVLFSHCNTLAWRCILFVNSGHPCLLSV
jgi:hypothetical protein